MTQEPHRPDRPGQDARQKLSRQIAAKQARKLRAQQQRDRSAWFGLGMFGLVGWSVTLPAVAFIALGIWIDSRSRGAHSWTLMLLVIGVGIGCLNAWFWISRERREIEKEHQLPEEENDHDRS